MSEDNRVEPAIASLRKYLNAKNTEGMSGDANDEFHILLEKTKAKLGTNASKIAEEFILRSQLDAEKRHDGK